MSPRRAPAADDSAGGRVALTIVLVLGVAIVMVLLVRARPSPEPFDPRSSRPDGARALVLLLEARGATVTVGRGVPTPGTLSRVLVLADRLGARQRAELLEFVEAGGVAVVADPASTLHGGPGLDGGSIAVEASPQDLASTAASGTKSARDEANVTNDECSIDALMQLRGVLVPDGLLFPVGPDEPACVAMVDDGLLHAFVIRRQIGAGVFVGLGDNEVFTNRYLRYADNSGLAVALLAPVAGSSVTVVIGDEAARAPADIGTGDDTLRDLVRPGLWMGFAQLAVAFMVFAVARGVRVGRPVVEPLPVGIAGSEAVRARAMVMQRAGHAARAGEMISRDLHRDLCTQLELPTSADAAEVATAAARRWGLDAASVSAVLAGLPSTSNDVVELSRQAARVRSSVPLDASATDLSSTPISHQPGAPT